MNPEIEFAGIYLSSVVAIALLAFIAAFLLRKIIGQAGLYRHIWHPALFDAALFVLLWAGIEALLRI